MREGAQGHKQARKRVSDLEPINPPWPLGHLLEGAATGPLGHAGPHCRAKGGATFTSAPFHPFSSAATLLASSDLDHHALSRLITVVYTGIFRFALSSTACQELPSCLPYCGPGELHRLVSNPPPVPAYLGAICPPTPPGQYSRRLRWSVMCNLAILSTHRPPCAIIV